MRKKQATMCGTVVDIGSGSVGVSILRSNPQKQIPELLYCTREHMPVRQHMSAEDRVRHMRHALFTVMLDLAQRGIPSLRQHGVTRPPERILVSCTAPWSRTVTQMIHYNAQQEIEVTAELIAEIVANAEEKLQEASGAPHEQLLTEFNMKVVEKTIVDVALNGYHVEDPYGKTATEIDIAHLRGLVADSILSALREVDQNILGDMTIRTHTSAVILYCVLRDLHPKIHEALIIDISGEATEISLMRDEILYESTIAPYGLNTLTREVARTFKVLPEEARTYIRAYKQGTALTDAQQKKLEAAQQPFTEAIEGLLHELSSRYVLPQTVFLVLDQQLQPFFTDIITRACNASCTHTENIIVPLAPDHTFGLASVPQHTPLDPRLALAARFFHKLHACGEIDK